MAYAMMDFLFASQDASTASLTWIFHVLDYYPDVKAKLIEEQLLVRPADEPITHEVRCAVGKILH